jgi:tetratricopeptide (TPR) repeat protein
MADQFTIPENAHAGSRDKWRLPLALALIAAMTVAVYWPVLHNGFIDYDDTDYVTVNMTVRQGVTLKGFIWAFTAFHAGNWHPLTWLSHMLDIQLFDLNPAGHHAVSLLFHTVNAVLLCAVFYRLTGFLGRSLVVAMLFALHPLHVESVAWIAERKDVLSTLFWLLTMAAYASYVRKRSLSRYCTVLLLFALGLMAKQMLVTLPLVLLLMDYWPLRRISPHHGEGNAEQVDMKILLVEKVPLLLLSAVASLVTLRSQTAAGALSRGAEHSTLLFAGNALISYVKYIGKMFWPSDLALFYPFDPSTVTPLRVAGSVALLAVITGCVIVQRSRRPYLLFGWFWYLITLLPVIGFIRVGSQAMADRYTYIPLTGLFLMVVWGAAEIAGRWRRGYLATAGATAVAVALLSVLTVAQIRCWRDSYDLYAHALAVVDDNWLAHNNMGILLAQQYRYADAIHHFQESLRIYPNQAAGLMNLGNAYQSTGNTPAAIEAFRAAVRLSPNDVEGHFRLGYAYLTAGNVDLAYQEYLQLQRLDESHARPLLDSIRMSGRH